MSDPTNERLYKLLPAVYQVRDAALGEPLRALLAVIEDEVQRLEDDIAGLYKNWFIETCDEWVVAYLGDLLGVHGLLPVRDGAFSQRALVANTIGYRRRKGTGAVLEQLARDITHWPARAVEYFELLATTQHVNHIRLHNRATVDLCDVNQLGLINGPFERAAHTGEVRHIDNGRGKYNISHVGVFLWRLQSYAMTDVTPRAAAAPADGRYSFQALGYDAALFTRPQTEAEITQLAEEINVPGSIRPAAFFFDLQEFQSTAPQDRPAESAYYGPNRSLHIIKEGTPVPPASVVCKDLRHWDRPPAGKVAVDVRRGRLAFALGEEPDDVRVSYNYGFSGDLGGGPYDRRQRRLQPDEAGSHAADTVADNHPDTVADPGVLGVLIQVPSPGIDTLSEALAAWELLARLPAVIQINDNRTYAENLAINMAGATLVIQAANHRRLAFVGDVAVTGGSPGAALELNGLLMSGNLRIEGTLESLRLVHCTLVPGRRLDLNGQPQEPDQPSVIVEAPNDRLTLAIDHSIVGPLQLPTDIASLEVQDSIIDSPVRDSRAHVIPALISGSLPSINLSANAPAVNVTIGDEGPHQASFAADQPKPATLTQARSRLQEAIQSAYDSPAFKNSRVITIPGIDRLIIVPGTAAAITIEATATDITAAELQLDRTSARQAYALVSGPLTPFPTLSAVAPSMTVTIGAEGPRTITLAGPLPTSVGQARNALQQALQNAPEVTAAFTAALVGNLDDRLVVLPGTGEGAAVFRTAPTDTMTVKELALESDRPAIAASDRGEQPGPPTILQRTTVLGMVHVKELILASEVICTNPVRADRHQAACVRFSYMPDGSRTPQRYRCQPDLAIQKALEAALQANPSLTPTEQGEIQRNIRLRVTPSFTSVRYGEPGYAQLSLMCPEEITTGAEDEDEMGAFNFLQQAQRMKNLQASLDEYLRFGLEAGIFFVT
jgi:hypothetical protein